MKILPLQKPKKKNQMLHLPENSSLPKTEVLLEIFVVLSSMSIMSGFIILFFLNVYIIDCNII